MIVGIDSYPPHVYIKDGQMAGLLHKTWRESYSFVEDHFNVTMIPLVINDDDIISLYKYADYVPQVVVLPLLKMNITSGPVVSETSCHLSSRPEGKNSLILHQFTDSFDAMSKSGAISVLAIILLFLFLSWILYRKHCDNFFDSLWIELGTFFREIYPSSNHASFRILAITMIATFFILQTVFLGLIKTDMVSSSDYRKIETYEDMVKFNITPFLIDFSACRFLIMFAGLTSEGLKKRIVRDRYTSSFVADKLMKAESFPSSYCFIGTRGDRRFMLECLCIYLPHLKSEYYTSPKPAFQYPWNIFHRKNLNKKVQKKFYHNAGGFFEMGITKKNPPVSEKLVHDYNNQYADNQCLEDAEINRYIALNPLGLAYFTNLYQFYFVVVATSFVIFFINFSKKRMRRNLSPVSIRKIAIQLVGKLG